MTTTSDESTPLASTEDRIPIVIGITGHRDPADPTRLERHLEVVFRAIDREVPHSPIWLLTPLAAGTDQIFARTGLRTLAACRRDRGSSVPVDLAVPLPFTIEDYRCDFEDDPASLATFDELAGRARWRLELPPRRVSDLVAATDLDGRSIQRVGTLPDLPASAVRAVHYDRLGRFMAAHVHLMIAAWDGDLGPRGRPAVGGTAAVLQYCRRGDATERGQGIPGREDLSPLLTRPRVPTVVVPCPRRRAGGRLPDTERWGSWPDRLDDSTDHDLTFLLENSPTERLLGLAAPYDATEPTDTPQSLDSLDGPAKDEIDPIESMKRIDQINTIAQPEEARRLGESGIHEDTGPWAFLAERIVGPVHLALTAGMWSKGREANTLRRRIADAIEPISGGKVGGGFVPEAWRSPEPPADGPEDDEPVHTGHLLGIFRRLDAVAGLDKRAYERASLLATLLLGLALLFLQVYGVASSWGSIVAVTGYLLLLLGYWRWKRTLRDKEQERGRARTLAELLRIQIAWRLAGLRRLVDDRIIPRRRQSLNALDPVLVPLNLIALGPMPAAGRKDGLKQSYEGWIRDQLEYFGSDGSSIKRKREAAERRRKRIDILKASVVGVAVVAAATSILTLTGLLPSAMDRLPIEEIAGAFMGVSLFLVFITQFRAQCALDREDAEAADLSQPLFEQAARCLETRDRSGGGEGVTGENTAAAATADPLRVLEDLGTNIADEQIEWYERRDRGADLDTVG